MANKATVTKILNRSDRAVAVEVVSVTEDILSLKMHYMISGGWCENYRKVRTCIEARVVRNEKVQYKKTSGKTFTNRSFLTSAFRMEDICFVTKADAGKAEAYLKANPAERLMALDNKNAQKANASKERSRIREHDNMENLFKDSPVSLSDVILRGKELAPQYMIVKDHIGKCSYCGRESPVEVAHNKKMVCPSCGKDVKTVHANRLSTSWLYDSLWIIVPRFVKNGNERTEIASYYNYTQKVYMDEEPVVECRESARSIGAYGKTNRKYWCSYYNGEKGNWSWNRGRPPHFIPYGIGGSGPRKDWCEWGYIIPKQYLSYLRDKCKECSRMSLDFFVNDSRDVWIAKAEHLKETMCSENSRTVVRLLSRSGFFTLADIASVSNSCSTIFKMDGKSAQEILRLNRKQYNDFVLSDMTYDTLKKIQKSEDVCYKEPDAEKYRALIRGSIPKNAISAGTSYIIPVKERSGRFLCYVYKAETDMETITRETWYVKDASSQKSYEKIGNRWYEISLMLKEGNIHLLKEDFQSLCKERIPYMPKEVLSSEKCRKSILVQMIDSGLAFDNSPVLLYEKMSKAGFESIAKDILHLIVSGDLDTGGLGRERIVKYSALVREYVKKMLTNVSCGKLHHVLMLPKRVFQSAPRKDVTVEQLAWASKVCAMDPTADYDDAMNMMTLARGMREPESLYNGHPLKETLAYIKANNIVLHEYATYIKNLKVLNVPMNVKEVFPKDFEKAQTDAARKCSMIEDKTRTESMAKIRKALMSSKTVRNYLKTNTNYLIFVPESPFELIREGKRLHNCLSTYVDQVANGKTSVFFIRNASDPNAPLYAMEIRNGDIVQIHGVNNSDVPKDSDVNQFAKGFAKVLHRIHYDPSAALAA